MEDCINAEGTTDLTFLFPNWGNFTVCSEVKGFAESASNEKKSLADSLPWKWDSEGDKWLMPESIQEWFNAIPMVGRVVVFIAGALPLGIIEVAAKIIGKVGGCNLGSLVWPITIGGLLDSLERWVGIRLPNIKRPLEYVTNHQCPTELPDQGSLNLLYNTGRMDQGTWQCLTRAIGNLDTWASEVRQVTANNLSPSQMAIAEFRGLYGIGGAAKAIHNIYGFTKGNAEAFVEVSRFVPSAPDVVSFMVRDAFDPEVVKVYGYDDGFEKKFDGPAKAWMQANGSTEDVARTYWRAHWTLPSNTQLYEMLHRQRDDSLDPDAKRLAIGLQGVMKAMEVNDIPTFWRERLANISYLPMNRTELRGSYYQGSITRDEVLDGLQNTGLNKRDAGFVLKTWDQAKRLRFQNLWKGITPTKVAKWLRTGTISDAEAIGLYQDAGLLFEQATEAVKWVRKDIVAERHDKKIKLLYRRYMVGDFLPDQAKANLIAVGVEAGRADELVNDWEYEVQTRGKQVAATVMCGWFYRSLITADEYYIRLRRIGYNDTDARRIVSECSQGNVERGFDRKVKNLRGQKVIEGAKKKGGGGGGD